MNKLLTTLITASLTILFLALGCGAWLFWQSWEEGKRLERENRELQASLEASRIRLDNFCEYPVEALCDVPAEIGSVSSVMNGMHDPLPEPPAAPKASPSSEAAPEPEIAVPSEEKHADEPLPEPKNITVAASVPATAESAPKENVSSAVPALPTDKEVTPAVSEKAISDVSPQASPHQNAEPQKTAQNLKEQPKKTWTTLEQGKEDLKLRIAGAGSSLTAEGKLLSEPLRYEATLHGLWKIAPKRVKTTLVTDMRQEFRNGDTVLTFVLSRQPEQCLLEQEDARTIAVTIR